MAATAKVNAPIQSGPVISFLPGQRCSVAGGLIYTRPLLPKTPSLIQPKLAIGEADDEYEREADRVADTIMRMPEPRLQRT
jgi:hypothetical protein